MMSDGDDPARWDEGLSRQFIDYGRYFVPDREAQMVLIADLLPLNKGVSTVIELCCGEGMLAETILSRHPDVRVIGYDGSTAMLENATRQLARFGDRFQPVPFDLADHSWRDREQPVQAVVTSLAVHHLLGIQKQKLFADIYRMLAPGGAFIIADIVKPNHPRSESVAAEAYDAAVLERSLKLDGDTRAFEFFNNEGWNIFKELDPEDIDKPSPLYDQLVWLDRAGFSNIDVFWMRAGHAVFGGWKKELDEPEQL
jgi:cyclopropane fatty-acyl-phospholipid synthase-like methyltransferase